MPDQADANPVSILRRYSTEIPEWLAKDTQFTRETADKFFDSRIVYYPGAGSDGHAFRLFGGSRSAYCVLHADYEVPPSRTFNELDPEYEHHVLGYIPTVRTILSAGYLQELLDLDVTVPTQGQAQNQAFARDELVSHRDNDLALWAVLERAPGFDEQHGPERLAFLHIFADGIWLFRNLWARHRRSPYAIILQDHGFGGNWTRFGGEASPLYKLAHENAAQPTWLVVGDGDATDPWPDYRLATSIPDEPAGMWGDRRRLYIRDDIPLMNKDGYDSVFMGFIGK